MKKTKIFTGLSAALVFLVSCKKDRVCECTTNTGSTNLVEKYTLIKVTKKQAKDICTTREYEYTVLGSPTKVIVNCTLK